MPKPRRRRFPKLEELPSLFDSVEGGSSELIPNLVSKHRRAQQTPAHTLTQEEMDRAMLHTTPHTEVIEFISFGSGSSGNSAYLGIRGVGGIIIDAGIDPKKVYETLDKNFIDKDEIAGVILTHDHSDHVRYAYNIVRHQRSTLYCTPRTLNGILRRHNVSKRIKDYHKPIFKEFEFDAGPFKIVPFEVSHDGTDNVGFFIKYEGRNFVIATDMGIITERADFYMRQANYLMIESNYDKRMLDTGRYPEYLKQRIRSERGHLDNAVTASYLAEIWTPQLTNIYLCHLSEDNNKPEIAIEASFEALSRRGIHVGDGTGSSYARECPVQLSYLPRYEASPLYLHRP